MKSICAFLPFACTTKNNFPHHIAWKSLVCATQSDFSRPGSWDTLSCIMLCYYWNERWISNPGLLRQALWYYACTTQRDFPHQGCWDILTRTTTPGTMKDDFPPLGCWDPLSCITHCTAKGDFPSPGYRKMRLFFLVSVILRDFLLDFS